MIIKPNINWRHMPHRTCLQTILLRDLEKINPRRSMKNKPPPETNL